MGPKQHPTAPNITHNSTQQRPTTPNTTVHTTTQRGHAQWNQGTCLLCFWSGSRIHLYVYTAGGPQLTTRIISSILQLAWNIVSGKHFMCASFLLLGFSPRSQTLFGHICGEWTLQNINEGTFLSVSCSYLGLK